MKNVHTMFYLAMMNDVLVVSDAYDPSEQGFTKIVMDAVTDTSASAQYGHRGALMEFHHQFGHLANDTIDFMTKTPTWGSC